jgi:hypothetical protein
MLRRDFTSRVPEPESKTVQQADRLADDESAACGAKGHSWFPHACNPSARCTGGPLQWESRRCRHGARFDRQADLRADLGRPGEGGAQPATVTVKGTVPGPSFFLAEGSSGGLAGNWSVTNAVLILSAGLV